MTPWPPMLACHKCGDRGRRNLGVQGWCEAHLGELFSKFNLDAWMSDRQHIAAIIAYEHDRVLEVPDSSEEHDLQVWGERLEHGVLAGVITRAEANRAWRRGVTHVAAA